MSKVDVDNSRTYIIHIEPCVVRKVLDSEIKIIRGYFALQGQNVEILQQSERKNGCRLGDGGRK